MQFKMTLLTLTLLGLAATLPPAAARNGHHTGQRGHHRISGDAGHGATLAGDQRHANDTYANAAAQEEDKLLDTKIKSICRGC